MKRSVVIADFQLPITKLPIGDCQLPISPFQRSILLSLFAVLSERMLLPYLRQQMILKVREKHLAIGNRK
jgi:hypothetical protein